MQGLALRYHLKRYLAQVCETINDSAASNQNNTNVYQRARMLVYFFDGFAFQFIQRGIAYQTARFVHLVHDGIANIQEQAASDATQLMPIADIHTGWAYLHALETIDTIALRRPLAHFTMQLAAPGIIGRQYRL